jgi:hypothetical protein
MPFLTNDIFTVAAPRGYSQNEEETEGDSAAAGMGSGAGGTSSVAAPKPVESYQDKLLRLKIFDKDELTLKGISPIIKDYNKILEEVGHPNDKGLVEMLRHYATEGKDQEDSEERYKILNAFTRVHELKASSAEFENFRNFIKQSDTKTYVSTHPILKNAVTNMK